MATAPVDKLTKAEREVIVEALELKAKSHGRAARASAGAIAEAHTAAEAVVLALINRVKTQSLEL